MIFTIERNRSGWFSECAILKDWGVACLQTCFPLYTPFFLACDVLPTSSDFARIHSYFSPIKPRNDFLYLALLTCYWSLTFIELVFISLLLCSLQAKKKMSLQGFFKSTKSTINQKARETVPETLFPNSLAVLRQKHESFIRSLLSCCCPCFGIPSKSLLAQIKEDFTNVLKI